MPVGKLRKERFGMEEIMPGPHGRMKSGKRIENPGKVFKRLMQYVMKSYGPHLVIVAVLIFVSVLATVQGTIFMQRLIDY